MTTPPTTDLFEVFKFGSVPTAQLLELPFDDLRKRYTVLTPLTSADQISKAPALATVPLPGHTVVDTNKFREQLAKQAHDIAAKQNSELMKRADTAIEKLKRRFTAEFDTMHKYLLQAVVANKQEALEELKHLLGDSDKELQDKTKKFEALLDKQAQSLSTILEKLTTVPEDEIGDVTPSDPATAAATEPQ